MFIVAASFKVSHSFRSAICAMLPVVLNLNPAVPEVVAEEHRTPKGSACFSAVAVYKLRTPPE